MNRVALIQLILITGLFLISSCKPGSIPTQISEESIRQYAGITSKATFAAG